MMVLAAIGVQNRFDRMMHDSGTPCSFSTFTACNCAENKYAPQVRKTERCDGLYLYNRIARRHDRIHQQHLTPSDVVREPGVHHLGHVRVRVRLDQDLADAYGPAAVAQSLLHGLAGAHDRHATVARAVLEAIVNGAGRRHHRAVRVRQLVETLLDHQPNQTVRVEFEVAARGVPVRCTWTTI